MWKPPLSLILAHGEGVRFPLQGIGVELAVDVKFFRRVECGELGYGHLVGGHRPYIRFRQLFLILSALDSSRNSKSVPHRQILDEASVPAPCDTRNVVGFIIRAVDGDEDIRNLPIERSGAVDGRLANITAQKNAVRVFIGKLL